MALPQESQGLGSVGGVFMRLLYVADSRPTGHHRRIDRFPPRAQRDWLAVLRLGLLFAAEMFASEYATSTVLASPGALVPGAAWLAWVAEMLNIHIVLIVPVLLLFPDGHLPGRRWRLVLWLISSRIGNMTIDGLKDVREVLASGTLQYFEKQGVPDRSLTSDHGRAIFT